MKFDIYVQLYCKDMEGKAFDYEYVEKVDSELEDKNGQFNYIIAGAIKTGIQKMEQENTNANVEVIHVYKMKIGYEIKGKVKA